MLSFAIATILARLVIPRILFIAAKHSLYDTQGDRKPHVGNIPRIGGVSFLPCILIATMFVLGVYYMFKEETETLTHYPDYSELNLLFCGLLLLYLAGVKDDLAGMRYRFKFIIQIISSSVIVFSGIYINNFYGLFGINEISPWVGIPLTVFVLVYITNAINLIDGIDGLASSICAFALCVYASQFMLHNSWIYAVLASSTLGVLFPFFYYNVFGDEKKGRKIFMGDSGSLTLGLILGFLAIRFAQYDPLVIKPFNNALVIAVSPLIIPMLDVTRVILSRIKRKQNIFKADKSHIHHKFLKLGVDQSKALILILFINGVFCMLNFALMFYVSALIIFTLDVTLWILLNMYITSLVKKRKTDNVEEEELPVL